MNWLYATKMPKNGQMLGMRLIGRIKYDFTIIAIMNKRQKSF